MLLFYHRNFEDAIVKTAKLEAVIDVHVLALRNETVVIFILKFIFCRAVPRTHRLLGFVINGIMQKLIGKT